VAGDAFQRPGQAPLIRHRIPWHFASDRVTKRGHALKKVLPNNRRF
jgi:hypothetical protein